MSNPAFLQRALAQVKLFFRNKELFYKATVAIALLLAVLVGVIEIFGNGDNAGNKTECNSIIEQGVCANNGTFNVHITQESQPILPNLEYLADKNLRMAESYHEQCNYPKALEHYEKAYEKQEEALKTAQGDGKSGDIQKKALADILVSKGVMRFRMAQYEAANKDFTEAESVYGKLSAGERDYAVIHHNRGVVFDKQGDYDKALEGYRKALAIQEKVLGKDHPSTATTYNNIAEVYHSQGKYEEALEGYRKALAIQEKVLGKDHPHTATTYNNIAGVYHSQGKYEEALEGYRKASAIREKVLGKDHPDTASTYNNIAEVYRSQGKYEEALEGYRKALAIQEKVLGKDHPSTA
ncbi:MAG: tetratricopeptide repeat protein, partial [Azoarcus sp.]|nr:tetratricopeptide repeat protein [Azoarcus sp.]